MLQGSSHSAVHADWRHMGKVQGEEHCQQVWSRQPLQHASPCSVGMTVVGQGIPDLTSDTKQRLVRKTNSATRHHSKENPEAAQVLG